MEIRPRRVAAVTALDNLRAFIFRRQLNKGSINQARAFLISDRPSAGRAKLYSISRGITLPSLRVITRLISTIYVHFGANPEARVKFDKFPARRPKKRRRRPSRILRSHTRTNRPQSADNTGSPAETARAAASRGAALGSVISAIKARREKNSSDPGRHIQLLPLKSD